ncbi:hypothetical protein CN083_10120 [Sinorhizobium meliloti]|nr:hypothetical protein CN083_10120 [Sinorhizobium meliloti]
MSRLLCGPYIDFVNPPDPFSLMADPAVQVARPVGLERDAFRRNRKGDSFFCANQIHHSGR